MLHIKMSKFRMLFKIYGFQLIQKLKFITTIYYGKVLFDFSEITINSLSNKDSLIIGIIVENKATKLMRFFKRTSHSYGKYNYNAKEIERNLDDFIHTYFYILWFSFSTSIVRSSSSVQFTSFFCSSVHTSITSLHSSIIDIINSPSITLQPSNSSN